MLTRYPIKIHDCEYSGFDIAFNPTASIVYKQVMMREDELLNYVKEKEPLPANDPKVLAYETFALASGHLNQLRIYVEEYTEIAGNNAMKKYFHRKYQMPYNRFFERGYMKDTWKFEEN